MSKRPINQPENNPGPSGDIKGTPAKLLGIAEALDEKTAIERAILGISGATKRAPPTDRAASGLAPYS